MILFISNLKLFTAKFISSINIANFNFSSKRRSSSTSPKSRAFALMSPAAMQVYCNKEHQHFTQRVKQGHVDKFKLYD